MIIKKTNDEILICHKGKCLDFKKDILPYLKYRIIGSSRITTYFFDARLEFPNRNIFILGDIFYDEIITKVDENIEVIMELKEK